MRNIQFSLHLLSFQMFIFTKEDKLYSTANDSDMNVIKKSYMQICIMRYSITSNESLLAISFYNLVKNFLKFYVISNSFFFYPRFDFIKNQIIVNSIFEQNNF